MEVLLMGTGASDGIPALFEDSRVSRYAREHGGKDIRSRAAALIDGEIKIDFGPDTSVQAARCRVNPADWKAVFFTHSHDDHLAEAELQYSLHPFTSEIVSPYTIFGNDAVLARIEHRFPHWPFELIQTKCFEPVKFAGYTVTPIQAYHMAEECAQNLIFDDGSRKFLYATDTGIWQEKTWEFLSEWSLDGLVLECTDGFVRSDYYGHIGIKDCIETIRRLRESGILTGTAPVVTTHHSHRGEATYSELESSLAGHAIVPGFDGMKFTV